MLRRPVMRRGALHVSRMFRSVRSLGEQQAEALGQRLSMRHPFCFGQRLLGQFCEWIEMKLRREFNPQWHLSARGTDAQDAVVVSGRTAAPSRLLVSTQSEPSGACPTWRSLPYSPWRSDSRCVTEPSESTTSRHNRSPRSPATKRLPSHCGSAPPLRITAPLGQASATRNVVTGRT
jgi:hypothetical protein